MTNLFKLFLGLLIICFIVSCEEDVNPEDLTMSDTQTDMTYDDFTEMQSNELANADTNDIAYGGPVPVVWPQLFYPDNSLPEIPITWIEDMITAPSNTWWDKLTSIDIYLDIFEALIDGQKFTSCHEISKGIWVINVIPPTNEIVICGYIENYYDQQTNPAAIIRTITKQQ